MRFHSRQAVDTWMCTRIYLSIYLYIIPYLYLCVIGNVLGMYVYMYMYVCVSMYVYVSLRVNTSFLSLWKCTISGVCVYTLYFHFGRVQQFHSTSASTLIERSVTSFYFCHRDDRLSRSRYFIYSDRENREWDGLGQLAASSNGELSLNA